MIAIISLFHSLLIMLTGLLFMPIVVSATPMTLLQTTKLLTRLLLLAALLLLSTHSVPLPTWFQHANFVIVKATQPRRATVCTVIPIVQRPILSLQPSLMNLPGLLTLALPIMLPTL